LREPRSEDALVGSEVLLLGYTYDALSIIFRRSSNFLPFNAGQLGYYAAISVNASAGCWQQNNKFVAANDKTK
jgi:hypothetical protein